MQRVSKIFIMDKEVHKKISQIAKELDMSTNALCRKVIKKYIREVIMNEQFKYTKENEKSY